MRNWQKSIEVVSSDSAASSQIPDPKTNIDTEKNVNILVWSFATFILTFFVLYILRPPFIETQEKQKLFESKQISWVSVTVYSLASAGIVFLFGSIFP
jgi:hypothetical protein